eukprot:10107388-Lingulodinium_polyedra.AAC.2
MPPDRAGSLPRTAVPVRWAVRGEGPCRSVCSGLDSAGSLECDGHARTPWRLEPNILCARQCLIRLTRSIRGKSTGTWANPREVIAV